MDPNLFFLDWERTFEVLVSITVLAFLLERALALLFEHRLFLAIFDEKGLKEPIAFGVAFVLCVWWDFDAVSIIFLREKTNLLGAAITAGIVAGGSKASIKLFRDFMELQSQAYKDKQTAKAQAAAGHTGSPKP